MKSGRKLLQGFLCGLVIGAALNSIAHAVDACSAPTGSLGITLLTNSDTFVSIPFTRAPLFCGTIQSVTGNSVTVQGAPGWGDGQWSQPTANGYYPNYLVFTSGAREGATFVVTNSSSDTLFLAVFGCDDLGGVTTGDQLAIIPYWSLGTVFPGGTGVTASLSTIASARKTQVLTPRTPCPSCSATPPGPYYFFNGHWRMAGTASPCDDTPLLPNQYFIVRNSNGASTMTLTATGTVAQYTTRVCLLADNLTTNEDNYIANYHSTTQTLDQAGLAAAFVASDPGSNPPVLNDLLLVYDNSVNKINKAPAHVYFYDIDHWADLNRPPYSIDRGGDPVFLPGTGVTVRKRPGSTTIWVDPP